MDREILFRGKRCDDGEWVYGDLLNIKIQGESTPIIGEAYWDTALMDNYTFFMNRVNQDTVCEYTGLKDKNGNMIFENDIIRTPDYQYVVKYEDGAFGSNFDGYGFSVMLGSFCGYGKENIEILGNVFDNPELISKC
jgi:uncharacterized phage protein (TIGR01671 family)